MQCDQDWVGLRYAITVQKAWGFSFLLWQTLKWQMWKSFAIWSENWKTFCYLISHSTIIPPLRMSWVFRDAKRFKSWIHLHHLEVWSSVCQKKSNKLQKTWKNNQNPLKNPVFWNLFTGFSILAENQWTVNVEKFRHLIWKTFYHLIFL